jgi:hypothetical protein
MTLVADFEKALADVRNAELLRHKVDQLVDLVEGVLAKIDGGNVEVQDAIKKLGEEVEKIADQVIDEAEQDIHGDPAPAPAPAAPPAPAPLPASAEVDPAVAAPPGPVAGQTLYTVAADPVNASVWAETDAATSTGEALYAYSGDVEPGDKLGVSAGGVPYEGKTEPLEV